MHLSFLIFIVFSHAVDLSLYSEPNDNGFIYAREQREFIIDIDAFGGKKIRRNKKRDSSKQEKKIKKKKHLMLLCMWLMATHNNQQSTEIERKKEKKKLFLLTYPTSTYFGSFFFRCWFSTLTLPLWYVFVSDLIRHWNFGLYFH